MARSIQFSTMARAQAEARGDSDGRRMSRRIAVVRGVAGALAVAAMIGVGAVQDATARGGLTCDIEGARYPATITGAGQITGTSGDASSTAPAGAT